MRPYLGLPWTDSHQIWAVDVFHLAPPIHGIQNAEMQKKFFSDVIASVLYSEQNEIVLAFPYSDQLKFHIEDHTSRLKNTDVLYCYVVAGGPYGVFAGHDASRALATFSLDKDAFKDEYDDLSDLNAEQMESVREWEMQFTG